MLSWIISLFKKIGFWLGSSKWLARSLVCASGIPDTKNIKVLELWAGYGIVTKEIIRHRSNIDSFTIIEFEKEYIDSLESITQGKGELIHGDARKIDEYISAGSIDIVISTLPLGSLDKEMVEEILVQIQKVLKEWGTYIQYQYWMANKKDVKRHFHLEKIKFEPRNFTPAFIYVTKKNTTQENITHH